MPSLGVRSPWLWQWDPWEQFFLTRQKQGDANKMQKIEKSRWKFKAYCAVETAFLKYIADLDQHNSTTSV